jgi:hypothetical protein
MMGKKRDSGTLAQYEKKQGSFASEGHYEMHPS